MVFNENMDLPALECRDWQSVQEKQTIRHNGRKSRAWRENAQQVQRVSAADRDEFVAFFRFSNGAQAGDRFGQRELFAADARNEMAPAQQSASFEAAIE